MHAVDDERLPQRAIEASVACCGFGDARKDYSTNGHLCNEIVVLLIAELVETSSHGDVMGDLNEASSFRNVCDVANGQITLLKGQGSAIFKDFVAHICIVLSPLVVGEEFTARALWLH